MPIKPPTDTHSASFEHEAVAVMNELHRALAAFAQSVGEPMRRAVDFERALNLDKKLAWQTFRLVQSASLAHAANVPPRSSVRRLLAAARQHRSPVPESILARVSAAFEAFEIFTTTHAGDRAGLMSMISGLPNQDSKEFDLKVRKALFRSAAHVWGIHTRTRARTLIYNSRPGSRAVDLLSLQAEIGLQRLRDNQPLSISVVLKTSAAPFTEGQSTPKGTVRSRAQAGGGEPAIPGPDLLTEFCSQPLPAMRPRPSGLGGVETELLFPASGRPGAVTLYSSVLLEDTGEGDHGTFFNKTLLTIPTETIISDVLIPAGWTNPATARAAVYARRDLPEHVYELRKEDLLPQHESFMYMGAMEDVLPIEGAPRHAEAVRHILHKQGWLGARFDVYRCRVEYPVLHSMLFYAVDRVAQPG